jgi:transposase
VRQLLTDLFGLSISTGMICKLRRRAADLLTPAYDELCHHVRTQDVHLDETGWREYKKRAWLWTVVAPLVIVFHIARSRGREVVTRLLGTTFTHVATCDRWTAYGHLRRVQWCWAQLRRDVQAMIDRGGPGRPIGEALLGHSDHLFQWWHRVRDGTLTRASFRTYVGWLRSAVRDDLEGGTACGCAKTAATCRALLAHERRLWTFVRHDGVEPTNNVAERTVRHGVLWRKSSGGTDCATGSRFVERILSVVATCRQQDRNVWDWRMPSVEELQTAIANGTINNVLPRYPDGTIKIIAPGGSCDLPTSQKSKGNKAYFVRIFTDPTGTQVIGGGAVNMFSKRFAADGIIVRP